MNLVEQPWIRARNGHEYSLYTLFKNARSIKDVYAFTPRMQGGLYRFLAAVASELHAECGDFATLEATAYLYSMRDRFNLFDEKFPFYQSVDAGDSLSSVARLAPEFPTGDSAIHFHHVHEDDVFFCSSCLAHLLLTIPAFASLEGRGYAPSPNGGSAMYFVPIGKTLHETLSLCVAEGVTKSDFPWHRPSIVPRGQVVTSPSYAEALTFQARRVKLLSALGTCTQCGKSGEGAASMYYQDGYRVKYEKGEGWSDPWCMYKKDTVVGAHLPLTGGVAKKIENVRKDKAEWPVLVQHARSRGVNEFWVIGSAAEPGKAKIMETYQERIAL